MARINFPATPVNDEIFVSNGVSFIFDDTKSAWRKVSVQSFYLIQLNTFTAPITGNVGFTPTETVQLLSIDATLAEHTSAGITIRINKNGTSLQEFTISTGELSLTDNFNTNSITTSDTVYLDIVSGSGTDLTIKFNYK